MKLLFAVFAVFGFSGVSVAGEKVLSSSSDRVLKVRSKDYTCSDLKQLVQDEGTVHIRWIGSLDVHSHESACDNYTFGQKDEAYFSSWKTIDKRFCVAGYSCRQGTEDQK